MQRRRRLQVEHAETPLPQACDARAQACQRHPPTAGVPHNAGPLPALPCRPLPAPPATLPSCLPWWPSAPGCWQTPHRLPWRRCPRGNPPTAQRGQRSRSGPVSDAARAAPCRHMLRQLQPCCSRARQPCAPCAPPVRRPGPKTAPTAGPTRKALLTSRHPLPPLPEAGAGLGRMHAAADVGAATYVVPMLYAG